jgi:hypothetical protein
VLLFFPTEKEVGPLVQMEYVQVGVDNKVIVTFQAGRQCSSLVSESPHRAVNCCPAEVEAEKHK